MKTSKALTANALRAALADAGCQVDSVSRKGSTFTVREGFFYRHGGSADRLAARILEALPGQVRLVERGEIWRPFSGGASVARSSHWFVTLTVEV